jgi:hypothetical protein
VSRVAITRWSLWRESRSVITLILVIEVAAVVIPLLPSSHITEANIGLAALLASLSISYSVFTRSWERVRRALSAGTRPTVYPNLLSAWGVAAAILLPPVLAAGVLVIAGIAEWPARNIAGQATPYRYIYSVAGTLLAASAAHWCLSAGLPRPAALVASAAGYTATTVAVVAMAVLASGKLSPIRLYAKPSTYRLDFWTCAIALAQVGLHYAQLPLLWLSVPATIVLQRHTVRSDLHAVAEPPVKPMSEEAWLIAGQEIVKALDVTSVIRVNSAAPAALTEIAQLQAGCDAIGYVGNSGLVMLLIDCPDLSADALAARLRIALRSRGIEASVAAAAKPRDGHCLDDLLAVCEAELITREAASRSAKPTLPEA